MKGCIRAKLQDNLKANHNPAESPLLQAEVV